MEGADVGLGSLDGGFHFGGDLGFGLVELRLADFQRIEGDAVNLPGEFAQGAVTLGADAFQDGRYALAYEGVVVGRAFAQAWPLFLRWIDDQFHTQDYL